MPKVALKSNHNSYTAKDIADFMKKSKKTGNPFVFFTGAGCSYAADIPLASGIVKDIQRKYKTQLKKLDETQKNDYGYCMSVLSKSERRTLIQTYIKKSKVNWAHIALACMMRDGYISRVLTFNFDNLLARASSLIGLYPATYDFTSANTELHHLIVDPAIVHLHGQGDGFVQLNTDEETKQQAENRLSEFVATTLNGSPSLFIGYSGGADAFFPLLQDKFQGQHHLIWTAHGQQPSEQVGSFLKKNSNLTHFIGEQDADLFLIDLANELGCFPPKLFENPYQHVLDILSNVKDFPTKLEDSGFNLLEQVKIHLIESSKKAGEIKTLKYEKLLMSGKYQQLINIYAQIKDLVLNRNDKKIFAWAYTMQGNLFAKSSNNQFTVAYENALKIDTGFHAAMNNYGVALYDLAKLKQDEELFKQSLEQSKKSLILRPDDANTLNNYGNALYGLARLKQDEELFTQGIEQYKKSLSLHADDANTLGNYGAVLTDYAQLKQDEELFKQSVEQYKKSLILRPDNADTINNYGLALYGLAQLKQDEELFKQSVEQYKKSLILSPDDADTINNYGNALCGLAQLKQDEELFKQSVEQYKKSLILSPDDVDTLNNYGNALYGLAQLKQDEELFKQSVEQYKKSLILSPDDANTLNDYGLALYVLAQLKQDEELFKQSVEQYKKSLKLHPDEVGTLNNYGNALYGLAQLKQDEALFKQGIEQYKKSLGLRADDANTLGNYGNALSGLARLKQDEALFTQGVEQYKKSLGLRADDANTLGNYGSALSGLAWLKQDENLFKKALELLTKAERLSPDDVYNFACYYSLTKQPEFCKEKLLHCERANTLPDKKHLMEDTDLDNVRELDWFQELLARLPD